MSAQPEAYIVFDVESVGLHGDAFAFGLVVIDAADGHEIANGFAWCDPNNVAQGNVDDREWVKNHIPPFDRSKRVGSARELRDAFWSVWESLAAKRAWLAADCPWPVEARFLLACIADDPVARQWKGPYPLVDVASVRLAAGLDPLGTDERFPDEMPVHDPLADARQSARLLRQALSLVAASAAQHGSRE